MSSPVNFSFVAVMSLIVISTAIAFADSNRYYPYSNSYDSSHKVATRSARRYCGNEITRTLNFLCESYNKRSSYSKLSDRSEDQENDNLSDDGNESPKYSLALVKVLRNNNDLRYFRRQIRGVVDECCRRSCTTSQLAQYCDVVRATTTPGSAD